MQASVHRFEPDTGGSLLLDDGTEVPFDAEAFARSGLRLLRLGQRVTVDLAGEGAALRAVDLRLNGI
jgi:cold shock CspA family protein